MKLENQITGEEMKLEGTITTTAPLSPEQEAELRKFMANGGRLAGAHRVSGAQLLSEMQTKVLTLSIGHALTAPEARFNPVPMRMLSRQLSRRLRPEDIRAALLNK